MNRPNHREVIGPDCWQSLRRGSLSRRESKVFAKIPIGPRIPSLAQPISPNVSPFKPEHCFVRWSLLLGLPLTHAGPSHPRPGPHPVRRCERCAAGVPGAELGNESSLSRPPPAPILTIPSFPCSGSLLRSSHAS